MQTQQSTHVAAQAFKILRSLYQLATDLHASENRQDLIFRILNSTIKLFDYRRAVLWSFKGKKPVLLGVSGRENVNKQSPLAKLWQAVVNTLRGMKGVRVLNSPPSGVETEWQGLVEKTEGLSVMWVPIVLNGQLRAGLWLERWGDNSWDAAECEIMNSFSQNLKLAWKHYEHSSQWSRFNFLRRKAVFILIACLLFAGISYLPTISLRVVAPCEVIPDNPVMVAAPLEGVVKEVLVKPGDIVQPGDILFRYEDRIVMQELKVAQKQVEIIKSQYDRMRFKSFIDNEAMEEIQSLRYRLEQEKIRLDLAESNAEHLVVRSEISGVCMIDHPEYWKGRPVQIGERVMMIFQPNRSKVQIFLPEKDNIEFDTDKPVVVILNATPAKRHEAQLSYVSPQTSKGPKGSIYFLAEAKWPMQNSTVRVGSKGTAIVYGEKVTLAYWLLRKPMAAARQQFGL